MDKRISLYDLEQLALILEHPAGFVYYNQTGGTSCAQEQAEGVLAFVEDQTGSLHRAIADFILNKYHLTVADADFIDDLLAQHFGYPHLKVNRDKLEASMEAWIHVAIDCRYAHTSFSGFNIEQGVLTWYNSD